MPKFEYVSHQLACPEYSLDDALSLTAEEFLVCSHLSHILPHTFPPLKTQFTIPLDRCAASAHS